MDTLLSRFSNPPRQYRGAPFWSWNATMEPDRLCRAIESMHRAGMGGFFMHSREGLKTPYLGEEWFAAVAACVEKARELGMMACLYDEDRWPSGPAGGIVTKAHPEYRMHALVAVPADTRVEGETIARHRVTLDDAGRLAEYAPAEDGNWQFVLCRSLDTPRWQDGAYLDTFNPAAVAEFCRVNYQSYADRHGDDFGGVIPAIFTDEPNYKDCHLAVERDTPRLQWSPVLCGEFERRRGYDIRERLPELVWSDPDTFVPVRYDYLRTLTECFVEAYSKQLGEWCGRHGIAFTGHMLLEQTMQSQIRVVGAAMPHYEHMQWPGIDILCDQSDELTTAKQCASVAAQLGKERVLSELYGCTGWDWPLEGHKFVGDWQFACGVNFRCQHLTHYSLAGLAKRDYPASYFDHSPWWKYYHHEEDYFARLGLMLTQGQPVRDVLVLHPIESAWGLDSSSETVQQCDRALSALIRSLSGQHYDWDFGDESLMAKYGNVDGECLRVGTMTYRVVMVPDVIALRSSTVDLLTDFAAAGGAVLFCGRLPALVDGKPDERLDALKAAGTICAAEQTIATLEQRLTRRVQITENGAELDCVWTMLRQTDTGRILFVQSHDRAAGHHLDLSIEGAGPVVEWDLLTGECRTLEAVDAAGRQAFSLELASTGSALVTLGREVADASAPKPTPRVVATDTLAGPFRVEVDEPNTMPLDYCRWRLAGDDAFSQPMPVLAAAAAIRDHFGVTTGGYQPWYLFGPNGKIDTAPRGRVELQWEFHITALPESCRLALEMPERFAVQVNGKTAADTDGYWVDEDIRTLRVTDLLRVGDNTILLTCDYCADIEIEDLYLVGAFGTAVVGDGPIAPGKVTLVEPVTTLPVGSWLAEGLHFYGGAVRYLANVTRPRDGQRVRLRLPQLEGTCAAIHANETTFPLLWAPFEADITEALQEGENSVAVEIVGGRKNILGPLHTPWQRWTGPGQFSPNAEDWTEHYQLFDHGLTGPIVVEYLEP